MWALLTLAMPYRRTAAASVQLLCREWSGESTILCLKMYAWIQGPTSTHWNMFYLYLPKIDSDTLQVGIWKSKTHKYQSRGMRMCQPLTKAFNAERLLVNPTVLMKADVLLWTVPLLPTNSFHLKYLNHTCMLAPRLAVSPQMIQEPNPKYFSTGELPWESLGLHNPLTGLLQGQIFWAKCEVLRHPWSGTLWVPKSSVIMLPAWWICWRMQAWWLSVEQPA